MPGTPGYSDRDRNPMPTPAQESWAHVILTWFGLVLIVVTVILGIVVGLILMFKGIGRSQARKDANNRVAISSIEIKNQAQRVIVAKQQADIRVQNAIGIREAQDEISKTLTPLYVQFEYAQVLDHIATSGSNNSVIYIPTGPNGVPVVQNQPVPLHTTASK